MRSNNKIVLIVSAAMLLFPAFAFAADPETSSSPDKYNMVLISLVGLMLILLFVIGMLANTVQQLSFVLKDKNRADRKSKNVVTSILLFLALLSPAAQTFAQEAGKAVAAVVPESEFIDGIAKNEFYAIMGVIALELLVIFALTIYVRLLLVAMRNRPELDAEAKKVMQKSWFWDKFNAAAPIDKEKDVLLDHNYDGIQELDNSLPPWWKYGFYLTIVVAFVYIYHYHFSNGPSSEQEYYAEVQKGEEEKAAYLAVAGNKVDETTVTQLTDAGDLAAGKDMYIKVCAACHLADGGGVVGPNLTDEYWIHGGSISDIFKSIKYGWQDKGMKSWKDDFSPKQIQQLSSFVKSLKGTKPATPKAPQGELYAEAGAAATDSVNTADSAKVKADSAKTVK